MVDTCYPNFLPFAMDEFERHLYLYYFNGPKPYLMKQMMFKSSSTDLVQGNDFLYKSFGHNTVSLYKEFKRCFVCQYLWKPIPARKLYPNWKLYPLLKQILYVFHFLLLLGCILSVDEQIIGLKGRPLESMRLAYNNKGGVFQADTLWGQEYNYLSPLNNEVTPKEYTLMVLSPLHARSFIYF